jgi:hypothetical protein
MQKWWLWLKISLGPTVILYGLLPSTLRNWFLLSLPVFWAISYRNAQNRDWRRFEARRDSRESLFSQMAEQRDELMEEIQRLDALLRGEPGVSDRSKRRRQLLSATIENREKKIHIVDAELWAREVQLWSNQLEGLFEEKMNSIFKNDAPSAIAEFLRLVTAARSLRHRATPAILETNLGAKAAKYLDLCLEKGPDLEERIRDAQVLAAVGEGPEIPVEFTQGGTWKHWMEEAFPASEALLPDILRVDEEFDRLNSELRLLRDGVKFGESSTSPAEKARSGSLGSVEDSGVRSFE